MGLGMSRRPLRRAACQPVNAMQPQGIAGDSGPPSPDVPGSASDVPKRTTPSVGGSSPSPVKTRSLPRRGLIHHLSLRKCRSGCHPRLKSLLEAFLDPRPPCRGEPLLTFERELTGLLQQAGRARHGLREGGCSSAACSPVSASRCSGRTARFIIAYLGVQAAGGVVVLVNTAYRQVELPSCRTRSAHLRRRHRGHRGLLPLRDQLPSLQCSSLARSLAAATRPRYPSSLQHAARRGRLRPISLSLPRPEETWPSGLHVGDGRRSRAPCCTPQPPGQREAVTERGGGQPRPAPPGLPLFHTHGLMVGLHGTVHRREPGSCTSASSHDAGPLRDDAS